jgi:acyl-CoA thioesterase-1
MHPRGSGKLNVHIAQLWTDFRLCPRAQQTGQAKRTSVVILQPGGNDRRKLAPDRTSEIQARLAAMEIKVVLLPNGMLRGKPHQPDGQHLTPEGYHMLAEQLAGQVAGALGR